MEPSGDMEPDMPPPPAAMMEPDMPPPPSSMEPSEPPPPQADLTVPEYGSASAAPGGDVVAFETDLGSSPHVLQICGQKTSTGALRQLAVAGCEASLPHMPLVQPPLHWLTPAGSARMQIGRDCSCRSCGRCPR